VSSPVVIPESSAVIWRRVRLFGTVALTAGAFVAAVALAPPVGTSPQHALPWLLLVASSPHVAATAWFASLRPVRRYARANPGRYIAVPVALIIGTAAVAFATAPDQLDWLLIGFFAWQFFHFQKQNLGLTALAGVSHGSGSVRPLERRAITLAGVAGIAGLVTHPDLLQLDVDTPIRVLFPVALVLFLASAAVGMVALRRRPPDERPATFVAVYVLSLAFFLPVFLFESPYAAVAGLTLAHGFQYLLIMGLVAGGERDAQRRILSLMVLFNVALLGGLALAGASHLHDSTGWSRALFGAYLGVVMVHFVVDAGLWRLRDEFPRQLLTRRVPYLVAPPDR
jgi:hypothetical protein